MLFLIAQTSTPPSFGSALDRFFADTSQRLGDFIPNILAAISILVVGFLVAAIASVLTRNVLTRMQLGQRLAKHVNNPEDSTPPPLIERWIANGVFAIIVIATLVGFLQILNLNQISQPLNRLLDQVLNFLPKLGGAIILLLVAWGIATFAKLITSRGLQALKFDDRLQQQAGLETAPQSNPLSTTLGNVIYWFTFLLFLPAILDTLQLEGMTQPIEKLLNEIFLIFPNILAALLIGGAGWLIAQVIRRVATNLLVAVGIDQLSQRLGLPQTAQQQSLSRLLGTIVYVLVLIPIGIAALTALKIEAISTPAISALTQVMTTLPQVLTAGLIMAIAYFLGRFISDFVNQFLTGIGFNDLLNWVGVSSESLAPPPDQADQPLPVPQLPPVQPSAIAGVIVWVAVMLFAAVAATDVLALQSLTIIVQDLIVLMGRVLSGLAVLIVGVYLANLSYRLVASSGNRQAKILGQTARIAILALISAMSLQQMGIATNIVNLAFGLLLGAIAVAFALAFGFGSQPVVGELVQDWLKSFRSQN